MKSDTVLEGLESLSKAGLSRTPTKFGEIADLWFQKFENMSDSQFIHAADAIIENETAWPSISVIYKYASAWTEPRKGREKNACLYCEDTGFLLVKTNNRHIVYACKCKIGEKKRENAKIAPYESLGIPWPEHGEKPSFSKKMSRENKKLIDTFLAKIGEEMPKDMPQEIFLKEDSLLEIMTDGSLEAG